MNRKIQQIKSFLLITTITVFFSACSFTNPTFTLKLDSKDLENNMKERFPIKQNVMFGSMTLKDPKVRLEKDSKRLKTGITFAYSPPFFSTQEGYIEISGRIAYKKKSFYMLNPQIEEMKYKNASLKKMVPESIKKVMFKMINQVFSKFPIYEVKGETLKGKLFEKTLKDAKVKDGKLLITFGIP